MSNIFVRLSPSEAITLKEVENIVDIDYDMGLTSIEVGNLLQMVIDLKEKYEDTKEEYEEKIADMREEFEEYIEYKVHGNRYI